VSSPSWIAQADQDEAYLGVSVATAGDVNGDGFADVIVGAALYDNGQTDEGRALVYQGSAAGLATSPAWTAESNQENAWFGNSVATAGDVNGDGFDDVIVGVWQYTNVEGQEGRAVVYHGSSAGLAAAPNWAVESDTWGAQMGTVATAGDVNGDGFDDVIVGAWRYTNGQNQEGAAFLYHGSAAGLAITPAWSVESNDVDGYMGYAVGTAGDVNGDGFDDVIVSHYYFDNGEGNEGRALVYHGSATGLAATPAWSAEGNQIAAYFGNSVGTAGDVNGDGFSDVIVGAYLHDNGQANEGRAYVYHGSAVGLATTPAWFAEGDQFAVYYGTSVGGAGDVNGDGFSDVIVGSFMYGNGQPNEGRVFVYAGSATGLATAADWTAESDHFDAQFGISAGTAGDVNGDDLSDVIVGAPQFSDPEFHEGRAYVYHGDGASTGVAENPAPTARFRLESYGPNPFATATRLAYTLPESGPMRLAIYDIGGREVALVAEGVADAGFHHETWDGRTALGTQLPAGVYFARFEFAGSVAAVKIVLAR
jgi:hypothetical protein